MHDRFLIIDRAEIYHIGASIKDLGKKCFGFTRLEDTQWMIGTVLEALRPNSYLLYKGKHNFLIKFQEKASEYIDTFFGYRKIRAKKEAKKFFKKYLPIYCVNVILCLNYKLEGSKSGLLVRVPQNKGEQRK